MKYGLIYQNRLNMGHKKRSSKQDCLTVFTSLFCRQRFLPYKSLQSTQFSILFQFSDKHFQKQAKIENSFFAENSPINITIRQKSELISLSHHHSSDYSCCLIQDLFIIVRLRNFYLPLTFELCSTKHDTNDFLSFIVTPV